MDRSEDPGRWLFIGLCLGALIVAAAWGFQVIPVPDLACDDPCQRARDLSAQQSMATAAWGMILATFVSAALGAWSLYLIRENLVETRKLARDAERSAKAAEDAIAATREMGMAQLRAYIAVTGVDCIPGDHLAVNITYANAGQSPARNMYVNIAARLYSADTDTLMWDSKSFRTWPDMASASSEIVGLSFQNMLATGSAQARYKAEGGYITVDGTVHYQDVFDLYQTADFKFYAIAPAHWFSPLFMTRRIEPPDPPLEDVLER